MNPALEHRVASTARAEPAPSESDQDQTRARTHDAGEEADEPLPFLFNALVMACVVAMVLLFRYAYDYYSLISQEDHIVEWTTVVLYVPAALLGLRYALRRRRLFDGLVALYCLFVGGEEFSWGQRLVGFKPPKLFLADNLQQEVSLHNFFGPSVHDLVFAAAVLGYGVLLPLLARRPRASALLERAGATAPPVRFVPWCLFFVALYVWYPVHLSSEWIEMIVAAMFLAGAALLTRRRLTARRMLASLAVALALGAGLTEISNAHERKGNPERAACARAESRALLADVVVGGAATEKLLRAEESLHRRIMVAIDHDYLYGDKLRQLDTVRCSPPADDDADARRRYAVDPWGLSYWFFVEKLDDGRRQLTVYSYGPNRRRDSDEGAPGQGTSPDDDDIAATGILPAPDATAPASPESLPPAPPK